MRRIAVFPLDDEQVAKQQLLHWAANSGIALLLDSNPNPDRQPTDWHCLVAAGAAQRLEFQAGSAFRQLRTWLEQHNDWLFGYLGYDLKNEVEQLHSAHFDGIGLPDMGFFQPENLAGIRNGHLEIHCLHDDPHEVWSAILETPVFPHHHAGAPRNALRLQPRISRAEYLRTIDAIRRHIIEGDVYEMNFCQEFFAEKAVIDPLATYIHLNALSAAPFAAFLRWDDRYLLCASPERFLRKEGNSLLSQPIKGTRRRGADPEEDAAIRQELAGNLKDRAENVMIVDLVRNDLARNCRPGSVVVEELFGIHSFATVHQMISSIRGELKAGTHPVDALRDAFPMGSMTGAPKVKAMSLIERYERSRRGLYSGAVGYFDPAGNFDFNVIIRSILYNARNAYVSVQVGGAIVYDSVPEQEYEECQVKAAAMRQALEG